MNQRQIETAATAAIGQRQRMQDGIAKLIEEPTLPGRNDRPREICTPCYADSLKSDALLVYCSHTGHVARRTKSGLWKVMPVDDDLLRQLRGDGQL